MWDRVGMSRTDEGLRQAVEQIRSLKQNYWKDVFVPGPETMLNKNLEYALRLADFLELGELMARDGRERKESCGGHFREEYQTEEGEAKRDDANYTHVSVWEYGGQGGTPTMHKESLRFDYVTPSTRSYK